MKYFDTIGCASYETDSLRVIKFCGNKGLVAHEYRHEQVGDNI